MALPEFSDDDAWREEAPDDQSWRGESAEDIPALQFDLDAMREDFERYMCELLSGENPSLVRAFIAFVCDPVPLPDTLSEAAVLRHHIGTIRDLQRWDDAELRGYFDRP